MFQLKVEDLFDSISLNQNLWNIGDFAETSNNELEYYSSANVTLANSCVILEARKEAKGGRQWTSGQIDTHGKLESAEGAYEARIRFQSVPGAWPAFWTFCWPWPDETEKDIFEYFGKASNRLSGAIHWNAGGDQWQSTLFPSPSPSWFNDFHVYRFEFVGDVMKWFLDGVLVMSKNRSDIPSHWDDFKRLNHVEFNLAVGGGGGIPDAASYPTRMEIDTFRYYTWIPDSQPSPLPTPQPGGNMILTPSLNGYVLSFQFSPDVVLADAIGKQHLHIISDTGLYVHEYNPGSWALPGNVKQVTIDLVTRNADGTHTIVNNQHYTFSVPSGSPPPQPPPTVPPATPTVVEQVRVWLKGLGATDTIANYLTR